MIDARPLRSLVLIAAGLVAAAESRAQSPDASATAPDAGTSEKSDKPKKTIWFAHVIDTGSPPTITGFALFAKSLPVMLVPKDKKLRPFVEVNVRYERVGWELFVQAGKDLKKVKPTDNGFVVYAFLNAAYSDVTFVAQGPDGASETHRLVLFSPEAQEYRIGAYWGEFSLSVGAGSFKYFQTGFGDFASKVAVQALGYESPAFLSRWGGSLLVRSPVWTVSSAPLEADPDLVEGKLDLTFQALRAKDGSPWQLGILGGVNYLTLIRNGAPFGFSNLFAPELGLQGQYIINDDRRVMLTAHYVLLGGLSMSERGLDVNLAFRQRLPNLHHIKAELIYSGFRYRPQPNAQIKTSLWSFLIGYTF